MASFEVFSQKGLGYEKVADTTRIEDGEKVLENHSKGYIASGGVPVIHKGVKPSDIEKHIRRKPQSE